MELIIRRQSESTNPSHCGHRCRRLIAFRRGDEGVRDEIATFFSTLQLVIWEPHSKTEHDESVMMKTVGFWKMLRFCNMSLNFVMFRKMHTLYIYITPSPFATPSSRSRTGCRLTPSVSLTLPLKFTVFRKKHQQHFQQHLAFPTPITVIIIDHR